MLLHQGNLQPSAAHYVWQASTYQKVGLGGVAYISIHILWLFTIAGGFNGNIHYKWAIFHGYVK